MKRLSGLLLVMIFVVGFSACDKDEEKAATEADVVGEWNASTTEIIEVSIAGVDVTEQFGALGVDDLELSASADETWLINADNTYVVSDADDTVDEGSWSLSSDGSVLTVDSDSEDAIDYQVLSVSSSQMKLRIDEEISEIGGTIVADVTYTK